MIDSGASCTLISRGDGTFDVAVGSLHIAASMIHGVVPAASLNVRPLPASLKFLWLVAWALPCSEIAAAGMTPAWMLAAAFVAPFPVLAMEG